jgi:hypothetical protein
MRQVHSCHGCTWAFEPLANMWTNAIDEDDESSSDDEDYNVDANEFDDDEDLDQQPPPAATDAIILPPASHTALLPPVPRNESTRTVLLRLIRQVYDSLDALSFVSPTTSPVWRLCQVVHNDTSPSIAKRSGLYRLRWWTQQHNDVASRSIVDSRFLARCLEGSRRRCPRQTTPYPTTEDRRRVSEISHS